MEASEGSKGTLVTGVIGEDIHNIGISILEHAFRSVGYKIVSLGVQCSQEELINAAIETKADALMVSTLSGHAAVTVSGLREKCIEAGLKDILIYVGGKLVIGEPPWSETEKVFKDMGIDRVYPPGALPEPVIIDLAKDMSAKVK
ncbi:methylaspartate mutase subunit S [Chloroflexota bacterium]